MIRIRQSFSFGLIFLASLAFGMPGEANAQRAQLAEIDTGAPNEEYQEALSLIRVDTSVVYLRRGSPFDPLATRTVGVPEAGRDGTVGQMRVTWIITLTAVLAVILFLLVRYGNAVSVSFGGVRNEQRGQKQRENSAMMVEETSSLSAFLERLLAMSDRREALFLLTGRALTVAADANALRIGRSQTARDVVRSVPEDWRHKSELQFLVRETEIVHFGGRPLHDDAWQSSVQAARTIFGVRPS